MTRLIKAFSKEIRFPHFLLSVLLTVAVSAVYSGTLHSPFLFDDYSNIVNNGFIKTENLSKESLEQIWNAKQPNSRRKIPYLTFAVNYRIGGLDTFGYHLFNLSVHILCSLLVALFFIQTVRTGWIADRLGRYAAGAAWFAAFFWALHPIQINSVTYIVQRMTSMATLFSLVSLVVYMKGRVLWKRGNPLLGAIFWGIAIVSWIAGLLCKENVAVLPLIILVHESILLRKSEFKIRWSWVFFGIGLFLAVGSYYLGHSPLEKILSGYDKRDFSLNERLMTEARVLWHYLSLFFYPTSHRFVFLYEYPVSRNLFQPLTTFLSITGWALLVSIAFYHMRKWPVFSWMILWFLAALVIESTVIPLEIIFEHRMYFPSIGLSLGAVIVVCQSWNHFGLSVNRLTAFGVIIIVLLGSSTYIRNMDFKDRTTLLFSEFSKNPQSERIRLNLAISLNIEGRYPEGGALLKQLVDERPNDIRILTNWHAFQKFIREDSETSDRILNLLMKLITTGKFRKYQDSQAIIDLAKRLFRDGKHEDALTLYQVLLKHYPNRDSLWFMIGRSHAALDNWIQAENSFERAWQIHPDDPPILYWYGKSLIFTGENQKGCGYLRQASQNLIDSESAKLSLEIMEQHCGSY